MPAAPALRWLSWRRLAVAGLVALLAVLLLGSQLPDPAQLSPRDLAALAARSPRLLAVARVFPAARLLDSPWLLLVPIVLAVAIAWNLVDRIAARLSAAAPAPGGSFAPHAEWAATRPPAEIAAAVAARLARRGYRISAAPAPGGGREVVGRRGALGFWGSVAFHVGLVLALAAFAATLWAERRAGLHLVEGDEVALDAPGVLSIRRQGPGAAPPGHVVVRLDRCAVRYQDDRFPVDYRADLLALDESGRLREVPVRVNAPAEIDGSRFLLESFGIAPVIRIDQGGRRIADGPATLSVTEGHVDELPVPGTADVLRVRWFGDLVRDGTLASSRSDLPRNPALGLRLVRGGAVVASALVRRGEAAALGPYRVAFPEARYWVDLLVERDPGAPILLAALALAAAGLALRFWDHDRLVRVRVAPAGEGSHVAAAARSRYFPALVARELADLQAHT